MLLLNLLAMLATGGFAIVLLVYGLALNQIVFTTVREGTAVFVMVGGPQGRLHHVLMAWKDHYINDPRFPWYNPDKRDWEILETKELVRNDSQSGIWGNLHQFATQPSMYAPWSPWRLLELVGIYYFGLPPLAIHEYKFEWTEAKTNDQGESVAWHRKELTKFIYITDFVYWMKLEGAEDIDSIPLDIDYLLTVRVTNPVLARFGSTNWLTLLTADANNAAKLWIGAHAFKEITRERKGSVGAQEESGFVEELKILNDNLPTDHRTIGAPARIGVTVKGSSLQKVTLAGTDSEELSKATVAPIKANLEGQAKIIAAEATAKTVRTLADAEKYRLDTTYGAIEGKPDRLSVRLYEAVQEAKGPVVFIPGLEKLANTFLPRPQPPAPNSPETTQPPAPVEPGT